MPFALAVGTQLNDRYVVKKVITYDAEGGLYQVKDVKMTDRTLVLRELIPPAVDEAELAERLNRYHEAVQSILEFDHPNVAKILDTFTEARREYVVSEHVEGVTMETVVQMSISALPEKQVIDWGMQMADALDYLHNRPRPFVFDALSSTHVMVTADDQVKLTNYGLERFFVPGSYPSVFAETPTDRLKDYVRYGQLMYYLLTKQKNPDVMLAQPQAMNPDLFKAIKRCIGQETSAVFNSFQQVKEQLEEVLDPSRKPGMKSTRVWERIPHSLGEMVGIPKIDFEELFLNLLVRVLSQKREFMIAEGVLLLALVVAIPIMMGAFKYQKPGEVLFAICGDNELWTVDVKHRNKVIDRRRIGYASITDLKWAAEGSRLCMCDNKSGRVLVLDTASNEVVSDIKVDRGPRSLFVSQDHRFMYCLHPEARNVAQISLDNFNMTNIFAVPNKPSGLAISPDNTSIFVSLEKDSSVIQVDADSGKIMGTQEVSGNPTAIALLPNAKELWVACPDLSTIYVYDVSAFGPGNPPKATLADVQFRRPIALEPGPDDLNVYALCQESSNVAVLSVGEHRMTASVPVGHRPTAWTDDFSWPATSSLWVTSSDSSTVTTINAQTNHALTFTFDIGREPQALNSSP